MYLRTIKIGDTVFGNDGSSATKIGDTIFTNGGLKKDSSSGSLFGGSLFDN